MKFRLFPKGLHAFVSWLILVIMFALLVAVVLEKRYIDSWQRLDVSAYAGYPMERYLMHNIINSFQEPPPKEFLDIYEKYGQGTQGVEKVNAFHEGMSLSGFSYAEDIDLFGREEYFATAEEFAVIRAGDCDEHSTARYHVLSHLGYKTTILAGYLFKHHVGHAVVAVHIDGEDYVLDINHPHTLVPLDMWVESMGGFLLVYTLDKNGLHIYRGELYTL